MTESGRVHASDVGKARNPNPENAIVYGSPRERTTETALRQMLANEDAITPDMSLEDLRQRIGEQVRVGSKDTVSSNLDFDWDSNQGFHDEAYRRYLETHDSLMFIWKDSDQLVRTLHDTQSHSYSRFAGNVAELVNKYITLLPRWEEIVATDPKRLTKAQKELQRFFGSHQGVTESFLMKLIEKTEGAAGVEAFIGSLQDSNGFNVSEGFSIEITEDGERPMLTVTFHEKQWSVTPELIQEIIQGKKDLDAEVLQTEKET